MKNFIGTKQLKACSMNRLEYNEYRAEHSPGWKLPENENGADEGYLVEYLDGGKSNDPRHEGYISWSPKEQFENAYQQSSVSMSFGHAIEMAKQGCKVARAGWNGSGMYAALMPGFPDGVPANKQTALVHGVEEGSLIKVRPYWVLMTAQGDLAMWAPSGSDSLANDWVVVD